MDETVEGTSDTAEVAPEPAADPERHARSFPGFDVLSEAGWWDETTRSLVVGRARRRPSLDGPAPTGTVSATRAPLRP